MYDNGTSNTLRIIDSDLQWALNAPQDYFVFGDYNINSCYWAIKLNANDNESDILCIYDWGNRYKHLADNFIDFLDTFVKEGPEALI